MQPAGAARTAASTPSRLSVASTTPGPPIAGGNSYTSSYGATRVTTSSTSSPTTAAYGGAVGTTQVTTSGTSPTTAAYSGSVGTTRVTTSASPAAGAATGYTAGVTRTTTSATTSPSSYVVGASRTTTSATTSPTGVTGTSAASPSTTAYNTTTRVTTSGSATTAPSAYGATSTTYSTTSTTAYNNYNRTTSSSAGGYNTTAAATGHYGSASNLSRSDSMDSTTSNAPWVLEAVEYDRVTYLLDRRTNIVYKYSAYSENEYPEVVGKWSGNGIQFSHNKNAHDLFNALDAYLKANKVRFSEMFQRYDVDRSGDLDFRELGQLVQELVGHTTPTELKYFQALMDVNGDGRITQEEFLSAAKEVLQAQKDLANHSQGTQAVLKILTDFLVQSRADAKAMFLSLDHNQNGTLEPMELLRFFKSALPRTSVQELRYLMSHIRNLDLDGDGAISFKELMYALRAVKIQVTGANAAPAPTRSSGGSRLQLTSVPEGTADPFEWRLTEMEDPRTRAIYLLDNESKVLYISRTPNTYPQIVGWLDKYSQLQLVEQKPESGFFFQLDAYLRTQKVRFSSLFQQYDTDRSGSLDLNELRHLVLAMLPNATEAQVQYFSVMLDVNGDGHVTQDEFMGVAKECLALEKSGNDITSLHVDSLNQISQYLANYLDNSQQHFEAVPGRLDTYKMANYKQLAYFLHSILPNIQAQQVRAAMALIYLQDVQQVGRLTFKQLLKCMRAVGLHVPAGYFPPGFLSTLQTAPPTRSSTGGMRLSRSQTFSIDGGFWVLEELHHQGEAYLRDPHTNKVYLDASEDGWPQFVGMYDERNRTIRFSQKSTAVNFFTSLDTYLKDQRIKLRQLFDEFDQQRKGYLSIGELNLLVQQLMPGVSKADLKYFQVMIDVNNDGRITYEEFTSAAKQVLADVQQASANKSVEVREALERVSAFMRNNMVDTKQMFDRFDINRNGQLEPKELTLMLQSAMPSLTPQQMRFILAHLQTVLDTDSDGMITYRDLAISLRAVDVRKTGSTGSHTVSGSFLRSETARRGTTSPYNASREPVSGYQDVNRGYDSRSDPSRQSVGSSSMHSRSGEWVLQDFRWQGRDYLLDPQTQMVYQVTSEYAWPELVGRRTASGSLELKRRINPGDLFQSLDTYLRTERVKLRDLFREFDRDNDGHLTMNELGRLVQRVMPQVSASDLAYFQAMMDHNNDNFISYDEFTSTLKMTMEAAKRLDGDSMPPEVMAALDKVSQRILANPDVIRREFDMIDTNRNGLDMSELAAFIRRMFPGLDSQDTMYVLSHLHRLDLNQDGRISFHELSTALHAVAPKHRTVASGISLGFGAGRGSGTSSYGPDRNQTGPPRGDSDRYPSPARPGSSSVDAYNVEWRLDDIEYRGKRYLYDPKTRLVYSDAGPNEWPVLVGRWMDGRVEPISASSGAEQLFARLDDYLKDTRTRFRDMFDTYDRDYDGKLNKRELGDLVRKLLPDATSAQVNFFMLFMDEDRDMHVSYEEFMRAAKTVMASLRGVNSVNNTAGGRPSGKEAADVSYVLDDMSVYIAQNTEVCRKLFQNLDRSRNGYLDYDQLVTFFRAVDPKLGSEQIRYLLTQVHLYDVEQVGQVTFSELLRAMRAAHLSSRAGRHKTGFFRDPRGSGAYDNRSQSPGGYNRPRGDGGSWLLESFSYQGVEYLIDPDTQVLYTRPYKPTDWPTPVGKVRSGGRVVLYKKEMSDAMYFFKALDRYLKDTRTRFRDLFNEFDRDRSGVLDTQEFRHLVRRLVPDVNEGQLRYFQAMMDCGGQVHLTCDEFLLAAKTCLTIEQDSRDNRFPEDVVRALQDLSEYIRTNRLDVRRVFDKFDRDRSGRLEPRELLRMLKELRPSMTNAQLRALVVHMHMIDSDKDGTISFQEMVQALRAVDLSTPDFRSSYAYKWNSADRGVVWDAPGAPGHGGQGGNEWASGPSLPNVYNEAPLDALRLDKLIYKGKTYLVDKRTDTVYEPPASAGGWPHPVGLRRNGQFVPKAVAQTAADLFSAIIASLKANGTKFHELFDRYDVNSSRSLDRMELGRLVRDMLGSKAGAADIAYFEAVLDLNGSRAVSEGEFKQVANDYMEMEKLGVQRATQEVRDTLNKVSNFLQMTKDACLETFRWCDQDRDGRLSAGELVKFLRSLFEHMSSREVMFLLTHMHSADLEKTGRYSFNDVLIAFRAIPVHTPTGTIKPGFRDQQKGPASRPTGPGAPFRPPVGSPGYQQQTKIYELLAFKGRVDAQMELGRAGSIREQQYLYEPVTGLVYQELPRAEGMQIVGMRSGPEASLITPPVFNTDNDIFAYLENVLKNNQRGVKDMFDRYSQGYGKVNAGDLADLVREILSREASDISQEERYLQIMLDFPYDAVVSWTEFTGAVRDCRAASKDAGSRSAADAVEALNQVSKYLRGGDKAKDGFGDLDLDDRLDAQQLSDLVRAALPPPPAPAHNHYGAGAAAGSGAYSPRPLRVVMAHLHLLDFAGDGSMTYQELLHCMLAVDLKLPGNKLVKPLFKRRAAAPGPPGALNSSMRRPALGPGLNQQAEVDSDFVEVKEWVLEDYTPYGEDRSYLLDPVSNMVYVWDKEERWPVVLGVRHSDDTVMRVETTIAHEFFKALDKSLRVQQLSLEQFLHMFNLDGSQVLEEEEFRQLVTSILPSATEGQIQYLYAMMDLDGSRSVEASEIHEVFKQVQRLGPSLVGRADAKLVSVLVRLSNAMATQAKAWSSFKRADEEGKGYLTPREFGRFVRLLLPNVLPDDLRLLLAYLHMLDVDGSGQLDWRELLCSLRAIKVRTPQGVFPRSAFQVKQRPTTPARPAQNVRSSVQAPHMGLGKASTFKSRVSSGSESEVDYKIEKTEIKEFMMELRPLPLNKREQVLQDQESGLLYKPVGQRGTWPQLYGWVDPSNQAMLLPPLQQLEMLEVVVEMVAGQHSAQVLPRLQAKQHEKGGTLSARRVARMLNQMHSPQLEDPSHGPGLLEGMLAMAARSTYIDVDDLPKLAQKLLKAWNALKSVDDTTYKVIAAINSVMASNFKGAAKLLQKHAKGNTAADLSSSELDLALAKMNAQMQMMQLQQGGGGDGLGPHVLLGMLEELLQAMRVREPMAAAMYLVYHCPHSRLSIGPKDMFKTFRAVKCKTPEGVLSPVFMKPPKPAPDLMRNSSLPNLASPPSTDDEHMEPVVSVGSKVRSASRPNTAAPTIGPWEPSKYGSKQQPYLKSGHNLPTAPSVAKVGLSMHPERRVVPLQPHKGRGFDSSVALDKDTGLVYRLSDREDYPDLLGKLIQHPNQASRVLHSSTQNVDKIFDNLRRIAGDEGRLYQMFQAYDTNKSGTLELSEIQKMCRQVFNMTYAEACFVQAMLDVDLSGTVSFDELVKGIRLCTDLLDQVTRVERSMLEVLNNAALQISGNLDAFWAGYFTFDTNRDGSLDIRELSRLLSALFGNTLPAFELRVLMSYVYMMDVEKDGLVRPDELLQHLHAIPLQSPSGVTHKVGFPTRGPLTAPNLSTRKLDWNRPPTAPSMPNYNQQHSSQPPTTPHTNPPGTPAWDPNASIASQASAAGTQVWQNPQGGPPPWWQQMPPWYSMPYMQPGLGPNPMVGYIVPYSEEAYMDLVEGRQGGPSGGRSRRSSYRTTHDSIAEEDEEDQMYSQVSTPIPTTRKQHQTFSFAQGQPPPPSPTAAWAPGTSPPATPSVHAMSSSQQAPSWAQALRSSQSPGQQGGQDPMRPSTGGMGFKPPALQLQDALEAAPYNGGATTPMATTPTSPYYSPQQQPAAEQFVPGPWNGDNVQQRPWTSGKAMTMADGTPYRRYTPFGTMKQLQAFIQSRPKVFQNAFMLIANDIASQARGGPRYRSLQQYPDPALSPIPKLQLPALIQRCLPGVSDQDVQYLAMMVDSMLPMHQVVTMQDIDWAAAQGASIERQVEAGRLPSSVTKVLGVLANMAYEQRPLLQHRFREMDTARLGSLPVPDLVSLLQSCVRSLHPSQVTWLTASLYWYSGEQLRRPSLTFEELAEALGNLASVKATGASMDLDGMMAVPGPSFRPSTPGPGSGLQGPAGAGFWPNNGMPMMGDNGGMMSNLQMQQQMMAAQQAQQMQQQGAGGMKMPGGFAALLAQQAQQQQGQQQNTGSSFSFGMGTVDSQQSTAGWNFGTGGAGNSNNVGGMTSNVGGFNFGTGTGPTGASFGTGGGTGGISFGTGPAGVSFGTGGGGGAGVTFGTGGMGFGTGVSFGNGGGGPNNFQIPNNAQAYMMWTHDNRQAILERYFTHEHSKKVDLMEKQKRLLDLENQLQQGKFEALARSKQLEMNLATLTNDLDRKAQQALLGTLPQPRSMEELAQRIQATMDEVSRFVRGKRLEPTGGAGLLGVSSGGAAPAGGADAGRGAAVSGAAAGRGGLGGNNAAGDLRLLLSSLVSEDWLTRLTAAPVSLETLQAALALRRDALELQRLHRLEVAEVEGQRRAAEMRHMEVAHAMQVQVQLLQAQLHAQAMELQRRLQVDAQQGRLFQQQQLVGAIGMAPFYSPAAALPASQSQSREANVPSSEGGARARRTRRASSSSSSSDSSSDGSDQKARGHGGSHSQPASLSASPMHHRANSPLPYPHPGAYYGNMVAAGSPPASPSGAYLTTMYTPTPAGTASPYLAPGSSPAPTQVASWAMPGQGLVASPPASASPMATPPHHQQQHVMYAPAAAPPAPSPVASPAASRSRAAIASPQAVSPQQSPSQAQPRPLLNTGSPRMALSPDTWQMEAVPPAAPGIPPHCGAVPPAYFGTVPMYPSPLSD